MFYFHPSSLCILMSCNFLENFRFRFDKTSVVEPEPPLLGWLQSQSRFFCWSEPGAGARAALFKATPAASFRQAKKKSLVLVKHDIKGSLEG